MITSWQVATAAEAFAAAQFARCGWDVSVQYGANQPEYDLVAVSGERRGEMGTDHGFPVLTKVDCLSATDHTDKPVE